MVGHRSYILMSIFFKMSHNRGKDAIFLGPTQSSFNSVSVHQMKKYVICNEGSNYLWLFTFIIWRFWDTVYFEILLYLCIWECSENCKQLTLIFVKFCSDWIGRYDKKEKIGKQKVNKVPYVRVNMMCVKEIHISSVMLISLI